MDNSVENLFAFVLGREQKIAFAELEAVLKRFCFCFSDLRIAGNVAFAKVDNFSDEDAKKVMNNLAGTVKIFSIKYQVSSIKQDAAQIRNEIVSLLDNCMKNKTNKVNFGISDFARSLTQGQLNRLGIEAKIELKKAGHKVRFVALTEGSELSSIQSLKNKLDSEGIEIGIFKEGIGRLISLNNPEDWSKIDYGKPAADKYSGMVPPKLARMMVNITACEAQTIVFDPFCGSGNILVEALRLRLGFDVIGSDISEKAVNDTKKNLDWLQKEYQVSNKSQVFQADATALDFKQLAIGDRQVAVIGEPFLGQPKKFKSTWNATEGEYRKIKDLYLSFFKNLSGLESKDLSLCLIFPLIETEDRGQYSLYGQCVDEIKKMGYTQVRPPFVYGRDYQVVKRQIVLLKR